MNGVPLARHDLLTGGYTFGAIQTTRGCSLNCIFCSVTRFNGAKYRQRPIADVVREFRSIREKHVLVVDDNLIGTRPEHIARAKDLFRAMAQAKLRKKWIAQVPLLTPGDKSSGRPKSCVLEHNGLHRSATPQLECPTSKQISRQY